MPVALGQIMGSLDQIHGKLDNLERRVQNLESGGSSRAGFGMGGVGRSTGSIRDRASSTVPPVVPGNVGRLRLGGQAKGKGLQPHSQQGHQFSVARHSSSPFFSRAPLRDVQIPDDYDVRQNLPAGIRLWVRDQGTCGDCWDFATVAAFEISYAKQFAQEIYASEQTILNCCADLGRGNCRGANIDAGPWYLSHYGTTARPRPDVGDDYQGVQGPCDHNANLVYHAQSWGYINENSTDPPAEDDIKRAILQYGAVIVGMYASNALQQYGFDGGDFWNTDEPGQVDHAVAIIGWSKSRGAWLIKNSWGTGWGTSAGGVEGGYMWVLYRANSIGTEACWVQAASSGSVQPPPGPPTPTPTPTPAPCSCQPMSDIESRIQWWTTNYPQYVPASARLSSRAPVSQPSTNVSSTPAPSSSTVILSTPPTTTYTFTSASPLLGASSFSTFPSLLGTPLLGSSMPMLGTYTFGASVPTLGAFTLGTPVLGTGGYYYAAPRHHASRHRIVYVP
jgi:hypothetical protein